MAGRWSALSLALALGLVPVTSCSPEGGSGPDLHGTEIEVVAVWEGAEARAFSGVLDAFQNATGATVRFTSTAGRDVAAVLDGRLAGRDPPDVALLPQPALLARYARQGVLRAVGATLARRVRGRYAREWERLATVDGRLYGVWFKAANKSLVWYSIGAFERAGVVPPSRLDALPGVAAALRASGTPAFSVAGAPIDAWTLTDVFENLYLRLAGPERYDALAGRHLPWTDGSVVAALEMLARLLAPVRTAATFPEAVAAVFSRAPQAAMIVEGDFVPGVVAGETGAEIGVDVDVFPFPEQAPGERTVVGGGDVAVLMRAGAGGRALMDFLASAAAAEVWAGKGGFVSPNESVDLAVYPDDTTRAMARAVLEAGDALRFDLSDLQPAAFGGTTGEGMWAVLGDFLAGGLDAAGAAARLESAAAAAWGR